VERSANAKTPQQGVGRLVDQMREAARSLLHENRERVAVAIEEYADVFRHAAGTLDRNRQFGAAHGAEQAAGRIERVAAGVRNRSFSDLVVSADALARRRPALFIAGAVAAGLVLNRLLNRPAHGESPGEFRPQEEQLRWR
jgi:hypothetical protein